MQIKQTHINDFMTNKDRVLSWLSSAHEKTIPVKGYEELSDKIGLSQQQVISVMHNLVKNRNIQPQYRKTPGGRKFLEAIEILKMPSPETSYQVANHKAKKAITGISSNPPDTRKLPQLTSYLEDKIKVKELQEQMLALGFPQDEVTAFIQKNSPTNPFAEEALYLLRINENLRMQIDSIAMQRDNLAIEAQTARGQADFWKSKIPEATREKLLEANKE